MGRYRSDYRAYILGPTWRARRQRHLRRHPWCVAHGRPCRARTVHHAMYLGWRLIGREMPWERVSLCHRAHNAISSWHEGAWIPNVLLFLLTWLVIGWYRLARLWTPKGAAA